MTAATRGAAEYRALTGALERVAPLCRDDWRFVHDANQIDDADRNRMRLICGGCPLKALCAAYADAARPPAGMWAGRYYSPRPRKD